MANVHSRELPAPVERAWELDNAERAAGGCPAPPSPLPRLLRVANAVEGGVIRLRRNPPGWLVPGTRRCAWRSAPEPHGCWGALPTP